MFTMKADRRGTTVRLRPSFRCCGLYQPRLASPVTAHASSFLRIEGLAETVADEVEGDDRGKDG